MVRHMNSIENIDKIRREAIVKIKEKIEENPGNKGYLHPCNKERQEDMIMLKFSNGNEFTWWMQQNGIMKNPTYVERERMKKIFKDHGCNNWVEYKNVCAKAAGFIDNTERVREWTYETGRNLPKEINKDCPSHFGDFTENLMILTFEDATRMPYGNPGFDWTCKKGYKIDNKSRCLSYYVNSEWLGWTFPIRYNDIADWFILSAWDDRESLKPLHVWAFHKNDMIRYRIGGHYILKKFRDRYGLSIPNTREGLKEFGKYEITDRLDKLKEFCKIKNETK